MNNLTEEKLLDLLCKKVTNGLDTKEFEQLEELEKAFPEWAGDVSFELAAAAINLTAVDPGEAMPAHLQSTILADAEQFFGAEETVKEKPATSAGSVVEPGNYEMVRTVVEEPKVPFWQWFGWGVAAFAAVALAVNIYVTRFQNQPAVAGGPETIQTPTPTPSSPAEKREQLLNATENVIRAQVSEADPKKQEKITGDIVWDNAKQEGYMRFRGLPVNNPDKEAYQLWIFDEAQDEKYPIDGGVFNVNEDGEIIIPIDAKIDVKNPKLFAVTREKPGGVVVSDRKGIVAVAKV